MVSKAEIRKARKAEAEKNVAWIGEYAKHFQAVIEGTHRWPPNFKLQFKGGAHFQIVYTLSYSGPVAARLGQDERAQAQRDALTFLSNHQMHLVDMLADVHNWIGQLVAAITPVEVPQAEVHEDASASEEAL